MSDVLSALGAFASLDRFGALLFGLALGFVAGIVPGIGGRIGLLLALPLAVSFEPLAGAIFLISLHSVVHTFGSVTPIAYGLPTSASEAATALDGFQMLRKGRGAEALGASLSASVVGGVAGAVVFMAAVPIVRPLVTFVGAPEFLVLSLIGIALVSTLSGRQVGAGLAVAGLGVLASTVGLDALTATPRFTFGRLELWEGLDTIAVIGGLFVVPEMLALAAGVSVAENGGRSAGRAGMLAGMAEAFRYPVALARSTAIGTAVGIMPGVGASVSVWIAYADAMRHAKTEIPFGQGAIAGVIAPEAANNAKEGGALIPTVFFGIPGSSSMAILLGGFALLGIHPGPTFLGPELPTALAFAWTVILANLLAIPVFLAVVPMLVNITSIRPAAIVPFALIAIVTATLGSTPSAFGYAQFVLGGVLGVALYLAGLPRAPFLLGFIIGPMMESSLVKTVMIYGESALLRPGVIVLALCLVALLATLRRPDGRPVEIGGSVPGADGLPKRFKSAAIAVSALFVIIGLSAIAVAIKFTSPAGLSPILASIFVIGGTVAFLPALLRKKDWTKPDFSRATSLWFLGFVALVPVVGLVPASIVFFIGQSPQRMRRPLALTLCLVAIAAGEFALFELLLGRLPPMGILGRLSSFP